MQAQRIWLKCNRDNFQRIGTILDFNDLVQVGQCQGCTGFRYKCPVCGTIMKGKKIYVDVPDPKVD
jgi:hypothetical protein